MSGSLSNHGPATNAEPQPSKSQVKAIGPYFIGRTIGEGTFGKVKLGTHSLTGEKVAIKILEKDRIKDTADVERVAREIHILKLIRHPHIIQLYEIIETPKQLYLIMEYASGGELFNYIVAHTRVEELEACAFFQQILAGVEYIGQLGIVHRDLKPENLLLDYRNSIKVVDFGLGNTYKPEEKLKTACGSPCYAAPEMIAGKDYVGLEVDIWSCGIILFALVCGFLPFEDPNTSELYKKILNEDPRFPEFISYECRDLIHKLLTKDPEKRLKIAEIRTHSWYRQVSQTIEPGIVVGLHWMSWDTEVLGKCEELGFDVEGVRGSLEANKHNQMTITYYLLLKRKLREGGMQIPNPPEESVPSSHQMDYRTPSEPIKFDPHPPVPKFTLDDSLPIVNPRHRRIVESKRTGSTGGSFSMIQDISLLSAKGRRKPSAPDVKYWKVDQKPPKSGGRKAVGSVSPGRRRQQIVEKKATTQRNRSGSVPKSKSAVNRSSSADYSQAVDVSRVPQKPPLNDSLNISAHPEASNLSLQSRLSLKPLEELMMSILSELARQKIQYKPKTGAKGFTLSCQGNAIKFDLRLQSQEAGHYCGLNLRFGDVTEFQKIAKKFIEGLKV